MKIWCCFLWKPSWLFYFLCIWGHMSRTSPVFTVHVTPHCTSYYEYFHYPYIYLWKNPIYYKLPFNNNVPPLLSPFSFGPPCNVHTYTVCHVQNLFLLTLSLSPTCFVWWSVALALDAVMVNIVSILPICAADNVCLLYALQVVPFPAWRSVTSNRSCSRPLINLTTFS